MIFLNQVILFAILYSTQQILKVFEYHVQCYIKPFYPKKMVKGNSQSLIQKNNYHFRHSLYLIFKFFSSASKNC